MSMHRTSPLPVTNSVRPMQTGSDYRNPHFHGIVLATARILEAWWPIIVEQLGPMTAEEPVAQDAFPAGQGTDGAAPGVDDPAARRPTDGQGKVAPAGGEAVAPAEGEAVAPAGGEGASVEAVGLQQEEGLHTRRAWVHVLDLAAGSGEATQALEAWWNSPTPTLHTRVSRAPRGPDMPAGPRGGTRTALPSIRP